RRLTDMNFPSKSGGGGGPPSGIGVEPPKKLLDLSGAATAFFGTRSAQLSCRGASAANADEAPAASKKGSTPPSSFAHFDAIFASWNFYIHVLTVMPSASDSR